MRPGLGKNARALFSRGAKGAFAPPLAKTLSPLGIGKRYVRSRNKTSDALPQLFNHQLLPPLDNFSKWTPWNVSIQWVTLHNSFVWFVRVQLHYTTHTVWPSLMRRAWATPTLVSWIASFDTVGSHLSKHFGTRGRSDNWISETILVVYKAEYFPFNAQQTIYEYHYFGCSDEWKFR